MTIETEKSRRLREEQIIEQAFGKKQQQEKEPETWQERKRLTRTKRRRALARRKSFAHGGIQRRKTKKAAHR